MGIHQEQDGSLRLQGQVSVDDAEPLMLALRAAAAPRVAMAGCEHLHAAALQVLLALRPTMLDLPADAMLQQALAGLPRQGAAA